jgi:multicomponent K+:H+ antiporter subunit G
MILDVIISVLLLVGGAFALLGSVGLTRLPDFFARLHGPTKATTLGVGAIVIASVLHVGAQEAGLSWRELGVTIFLFITAPVTAHLLSKAALKENGPIREANAPPAKPAAPAPPVAPTQAKAPTKPTGPKPGSKPRQSGKKRPRR